MKFRDNMLLYALALLVVLCVGYSYLRFIVMRDYMVAYQGACDPAAHSCFVSCKDDACTDKQYYAKVQKYAVDLYAQCGKDITDCTAANVCLPQGDQKCSITYCDRAVDGDVCSTLIGESSTTTKSTNP